MTLEEQILRLENQREVCLDEIEDEIHVGMKHLLRRLSPARFLRRHLVSSVATAAVAGVLIPWLAAWKAGKVQPFGHAAGPPDDARGDSREQAVSPVSKNTADASPGGAAQRLVSAMVRTAAVAVASRVDIPGLLSRWTRRPEKPEEKHGQ